MIIDKKSFVTLLIAIAPIVSMAQIMKKPYYTLETGGLANTGKHNTFWLASNQFGKQSVNRFSGFLSAQVYTSGDTSKAFDYSYGLELRDVVDGDNHFWLHQAYIKARLHFLLLRAGKCEETYGNQDSTLSSGSALWSRNSRPMPKILLSSNGFVNVPYTKGYIRIYGLLSHGWFGNDGYAKNVYLHHKCFYIRLGGDFPVNVTWGLEHYAMWGGLHPEYGSLPSDLDAYGRVLFNQQGNADNPKTPGYDTLNRLGNHLGSRNYAIDIKLKPLKIRLYYQTIFEDNSGYKRHFMRDGLWGIVLKNRASDKIVNTFLYERFYSMYQSGGLEPGHDLKSTTADNYFNHYLYRSGWSYHGYTIGSPLITSGLLNAEEVTGIANNRLIAHHIGIAGKIEQVFFKILATWSKNYGTYPHPFPEMRSSKSVLLQFSNDYTRTKGFEAVLQFAFDRGEMYGNNTGIGVTLRKHGAF